MMSVVKSSLSVEQEKKLLSLFGHVRLHLLYKVQIVAGNSYTFEGEEMHGNDLQLTECEVYRVEDCGGLLKTPWREIDWEGYSTKERLMDYIKNYKPEVKSVVQARVLLVGPVGAGKSSFFNSINSVFKGHVTGQANTGSAGTSLTTQFRTYSIKAEQGGKALPLVLCDTMGLEEGPSAGLDIDDVNGILKGHVQDRYQFNPSMSVQTDGVGFCKSPSLKDTIHCVVYVLDACKFTLLSAKMVDKLAAIRKGINKQGVPQLVLLTKVDEACPLVRDDLTNIYLSHYIERMTREVSGCLGVSQSCVLPVKNYSRELELDVHTDILLLTAVVQMLRYSNSYFDDIYQAGDQKSEWLGL
ncbi:interferon-induced protein 44-like isoform X2 [Oncorhynchus tshawytscha]|uniref:interferon-induced protein 44-like isoform X2 n=1 Tax=Oncorhynchus tshawytscha TaxID=74940 RepID=UPI001C3DA565|nr:interferon-induced protein 44-like isoform X2 [Oncorhynchus tshawytscha]